MAKALWPKVLTALRRQDVTSTGEAEDLMFAAQGARSVEDFEKLAEDLAAERPRG